MIKEYTYTRILDIPQKFYEALSWGRLISVIRKGARVGPWGNRAQIIEYYGYGKILVVKTITSTETSLKITYRFVE